MGQEVGRSFNEHLSMSCWICRAARPLTTPVYKSPSRVSRNLNYGASLPLTPLGTGDQPEPELRLTLRLAGDSQRETPSLGGLGDTI